jgi:O-antigen/teichoic acid export membrane protein
VTKNPQKSMGMKSINLLWKKCKHAVSFVRINPFDTSTPEGRANERHRRIALTALASAAAKGVNVLTALISVPLTLRYLGAERYGLWMTISSVIAILGFADLGMGNGLLNAISEADGKDDRERAKEYVSSAFFMLSGIAIILAILSFVIYPLVSWQRLFNVSSPQATAEAGPAMAVFIGCFIMNMPLGIVQRIRTGYQEGFANSLWQGGGNLLGLASVLLAIYLEAGLPWLVFAMAGAPAFATLLNGMVLFRFRRPWLQPAWQRITSAAAKKIFRLGILFFVLQIAVALAFSSDNIVAAQVLGPVAVALYSIPVKLFSMAPMILSMILYPLWPAYGESIARGDIAWVKRALGRSLVVAVLITALPSVFLVVFGPQIIKLWVGADMIPPFLLLLGFGVWTVMAAAGNAVAMFLNGGNFLSFQVVIAVLMSIGALILKIMLAHAIGLPGIIWATVLAYTVFTAVPMGFYIPRKLSRLSRLQQVT